MNLKNKLYQHWLLGEWHALIELPNDHNLKFDVDRDCELFSLSAGLQTLSRADEMQMEKIKSRINNLKQKGVNISDIASFLLSGVKNTLARAYSINNEIDKADKFFTDSISLSLGSASSPLGVKMRAETQAADLEKKGIAIERKKSLRTFYSEHDGYVSDKWSLYLDVYNEIFDKYREEKISLLEIGVQNGGSLEIWAKFFQRYGKIIGCDINKKCKNIKYKDKNLHIVIGDACAEETRNSILNIQPRFNIIIDDGSHTSSDIIKAFADYFPLLEDDGLYIVEDLHCSYWERYQGGLKNEKSSMNFFKLIADILNKEHWIEEKDIDSFLNRFYDYFSIDLDLLEQINYVQFFNSVCVIKKKKNSCNLLGNRFVVGSLEPVYAIKHLGLSFK